MITSNCKQKENKPKEVSLLRHGVARYVLAMKKTKNAAHNGVQADRSSVPTCPLQDTTVARTDSIKISTMVWRKKWNLF